MHLFLFLLVGAIGFILPWWLLIPCVVAYLLRYTGYELLILSVLLDVHIGMATGVHTFFMPFPATYTLVGILMILVMESIKPRLRGITS